ncbi:B3 domain-containing transcription factor VRN1-like isoform X2 [Lotus japonicus]|uniref:B3 domain-containing transcription factor VRN1-like isoform X2 n=1 Tax=Lotus japonicus TaxID=34305 RepID=UPI002585901F|nr:B3 domain-containing transcription factor VRN1-like isoform X2 [Lotus japonicus]
MIQPMAGKFPHQPQLKKPTHFFKIISSHSLHEGKLMIPRAFVEKYEEGLPKTMFLKPPNGKDWKLNLVKLDGNMWFQKGWKEFAEHHSLAHGHLLVFKYQRTSHFQVQIFDMSALEINYNFKRVEETGRDDKVRNDLKFQKVALDHTNKKCKGKQILTAKQATALDRANSFKTCKPFFMAFMHPSYFYCNLSIPAKFGKKHLDLGQNVGDIQLRVLNGRFWPARYIIRENGERKRFDLSYSGWKAFSKDNKLKVGDVCVFELIHGTKLTFLVHIFRESENSNCPTSQEYSNKASIVFKDRERK